MAILWKHLDQIFICYLASILLACGIYHFGFNFHDRHRCYSLLNDGHWLDPANLSTWQPKGCMLHSYSAADIRHCFADNRLLFIGGTRTRQFFDSMLKKSGSDHRRPDTLAYTANENVRFGSVSFEFIWAGNLNGAELRNFHSNDSLSPRDASKLAVVGLDESLLHREDNPAILDLEITNLLTAFDNNHPSRWIHSSPHSVFLPYSLPAGAISFNGTDLAAPEIEKVEFINGVLARNATTHSLITAFAFNKLLTVPGAMDGPNLHANVESAMVDILLNLACNRGLPKHYPHASTCCNTYPTPSAALLVGLVVAVAILPAAFYLHSVDYSEDDAVLLRFTPDPKYLKPILTLASVVLLCWLCDRTNLFEKAHKLTSPAQFFACMVLIILGSLYTLKTAEKDQPFLNRDQTDEWKGWMQVAILVYHYVGVSKTQYIYDYMRVCPTSYLFMTGFGHTVYFLRKGDFSLKRVASTMLRLNLLNAMLAYGLGTDWLLYYFAPLVTWNFFVIYFTLYTFNRYNSFLPMLLAKIAAFQAINITIYRKPGVLEAIWWLLQTAFKMEGDMREWRFRITLDQFAIVPGMLAAIIYLRWSDLSLPKTEHFQSAKLIAVVASAAIILGYAYFESSIPSKFVYNHYHPYTAWLPCVAYVLLRNSTTFLRRTHNSLFTWFGRGSLETFLLQFHIWLAADTAGLLGIPGLGRGLSAIVTTPMFLWVSQKATDATSDVIAWIMGADRSYGPLIGDKGVSAETRRDRLLGDYRVRIGMMLTGMIVLNWVSYLF